MPCALDLGKFRTLVEAFLKSITCSFINVIVFTNSDYIHINFLREKACRDIGEVSGSLCTKHYNKQILQLSLKSLIILLIYCSYISPTMSLY